MAKAKVGDIVLHMDGQYECRVLSIREFEVKGNSYTEYTLEECRNGTRFVETESYLIFED